MSYLPKLKNLSTFAQRASTRVFQRNIPERGSQDVSHTDIPIIASWDDEVFQQVRSKKSTSLTIKRLFAFSDAITPAKLISSGQFLATELPIRVAGRIADYQNLPFIVGSNPHLNKVYCAYADAFVKLLKFPTIATNDNLEQFTELLKSFLDPHSTIVSLLGRGLQESERYMPRKDLHDFLTHMLKSRIGIRLLAEHQIALQLNRPDRRGVFSLNLSPVQAVLNAKSALDKHFEEVYGRTPNIRFDGTVDASVVYIEAHFDFIITELLKNAMKAVLEHHQGKPTLPDILVTVCHNEKEAIIRISDFGGGIPPNVEENMFEYGPSPSKQRGGEALGYGLPMSRLYAEYFGGSLQVMSMHGLGTDVYLRLHNLADSLENVLF